MPLNDSERMERTEQEPGPKRDKIQVDLAQEEIVMPIEAEIEEEVEREFEKPPAHKKAIISVNGEDIDEVPVTHDRVA